MKKRIIIPLLVIVVIISIILLYNRQIKINSPDSPVESTGIIETVEVDISSEIQEKIRWLCCEEGDEVKIGDVLVRLYDRKLSAMVNEGKAMLSGSRARYEEARANLETAMAKVESARAVIIAAQSEIDRIRALNIDARENFIRISKLFEDGYSTKKDMDAAQSALDATTAQLSAAAAKKTSEEAFLSTAIAGVKSAEAQLASAGAFIEEARARLHLAETLLKDSVIPSPVNGVITYKAFESGETAMPGKAIYTIHDMQKIWARIDIEETEIGRIRLKGKAVISSDALPHKMFDGEISEIGREAAFATQRDVSRGRQDIKTFRIKVRLINPDGHLKPGMTVTVKLLS